MASNKSSLNYVLQSVLSIGNKEQNMAYAPSIFTQHFNIVTSFIIDKCVEAYPNYLDVLRQFIAIKKIPITNGEIKIPDDYRNILGAPSINAKPTGECKDDAPATDASIKILAQKNGCKSRPIKILDQNQWDLRTTSGYKFPTYVDPIGCFFGKDTLKVCPFDLSKVELRYVIKENQYLYNYTLQPDDTYIFKAEGSVESQWGDAASQYLVKGVLALYSAYLRDNQLNQFSSILNQAGIF